MNLNAHVYYVHNGSLSQSMSNRVLFFGAFLSTGQPKLSGVYHFGGGICGFHQFLPLCLCFSHSEQPMDPRRSMFSFAQRARQWLRLSLELMTLTAAMALCDWEQVLHLLEEMSQRSISVPWRPRALLERMWVFCVCDCVSLWLYA